MTSFTGGEMPDRSRQQAAKAVRDERSTAVKTSIKAIALGMVIASTGALTGGISAGARDIASEFRTGVNLESRARPDSFGTGVDLGGKAHPDSFRTGVDLAGR